MHRAKLRHESGLFVKKVNFEPFVIWREPPNYLSDRARIWTNDLLHVQMNVAMDILKIKWLFLVIPVPNNKQNDKEEVKILIKISMQVSKFQFQTGATKRRKKKLNFFLNEQGMYLIFVTKINIKTLFLWG